MTGRKSGRAVKGRTDFDLAETVCRVWRENSDDSVGSLYDGDPVKLPNEVLFRNGKWL